MKGMALFSNCWITYSYNDLVPPELVSAGGILNNREAVCCEKNSNFVCLSLIVWLQWSK